MAAQKRASRSKSAATKGPRIGETEMVIYPRGLAKKLGINASTRWRLERAGKIPKRDFFMGSIAVGWHPQTLADAFRGPAIAANPPKKKRTKR